MSIIANRRNKDSFDKDNNNDNDTGQYDWQCLFDNPIMIIIYNDS